MSTSSKQFKKRDFATLKTDSDTDLQKEQEKVRNTVKITPRNHQRIPLRNSPEKPIKNTNAL